MTLDKALHLYGAHEATLRTFDGQRSVFSQHEATNGTTRIDGSSGSEKMDPTNRYVMGLPLTR